MFVTVEINHKFIAMEMTENGYYFVLSSDILGDVII
jgi:hypothetical protein